MKLFGLFIALTFVNNVVLSKFYAICPLMGLSKNPKNALNMGIAVIFVIFLSSIITWLLYYYVLVPLKITYMDLITFILVIASLVQFLEMFLKKTSPDIYKSMGVYLPLITTNCAVLGVALDNITANYNLIEAAVAGIAVPLGFLIVIYIFATIRQRLEIADVPTSFKGAPIALITAGIMACAIMGIAGVV
ncbi:electron transport complex protein RnfA [Sharpea azabuensis]|uniref:Ion-translocating oxidoreductase complex subunit A n=1 Tax=Sharpea azabuensis TaxID=322505 RepID=A0A1H6TCK3_9FIRM|nr:RnfABCDGE type electron transport complex subunit A [Sharpea azabuensis]HAJ14834.1 RnfABCDGE type electron transport complex subunit A [Erysipelotrichaceae bacterium]MDD6511747.1 RnfABCDGE type electron transport complex subunit A [Sharpea azabuensis]MEE3308143.1 RnfABCDGE type electron transport complex subunit A [Sharpea azabuensis]SEI77711.1 electron transport complex protein RnfA [Sharpea azabuensis]HAV18503.1 RnfABCDGE type electron transport complex subunit A [Erysipelotrichaceae bact